jgi:hypothetical protein
MVIRGGSMNINDIITFIVDNKDYAEDINNTIQANIHCLALDRDDYITAATQTTFGLPNIIVPSSQTSSTPISQNLSNKSDRLKVKHPGALDGVNPELIATIVQMSMETGIIITITAGKSDHGQFVKDSPNQSRHFVGDALDLGAFNDIGYGTDSVEFTKLGNICVEWLKAHGFQFGERGNKRGYLWQTMIGGNHYNHIHVSISRSIGS